MPAQTDCVQEETFAPSLYVLRYQDFKSAIDLQNGVAHGLSSSIFSTDMRELEQFLAAAGSGLVQSWGRPVTKQVIQSPVAVVETLDTIRETVPQAGRRGRRSALGEEGGRPRVTSAWAGACPCVD